MTKTTFRERLVIELNNAQCRYNELMARAEMCDINTEMDLYWNLCDQADEYWQVVQACQTLLDAQVSEII